MFNLIPTRPAEAVAREGRSHDAPLGVTFRQRCVILLVACVTALSVMSAVLLAFVDDGRTPWFNADSDLARVAQRCDAEARSSRRHACLREVAQDAAQQASAPTRIARR